MFLSRKHDFIQPNKYLLKAYYKRHWATSHRLKEHGEETVI